MRTNRILKLMSGAIAIVTVLVALALFAVVARTDAAADAPDVTVDSAGPLPSTLPPTTLPRATAPATTPTALAPPTTLAPLPAPVAAAGTLRAGDKGGQVLAL
jgi:hypothetical protein